MMLGDKPPVVDGADSVGPLCGLRVVDLSPDGVGAQVSQTLADFGADVMWVEPPGGSRLRRQAAFPFLARGKGSLVADLKEESDVARVSSLAASADVLIETFRPGVADRLGLGYEELAARNPALVYTSITGFGRQGPWSNLKGYEGVVASLLGLYGSLSGINDCHPPWVAVPWCSFAASHAALQGILAALFKRESSGRGQWVEANLAQALTIHEGASSSWYSYLVTHRWPEAFVASPRGNDPAAPMHRYVFELLIAQTRDGHWLQFAQNRPHLLDAFMRALRLEWMQTNPRREGTPMLEDGDRRAELWHRMLGAVRERSLAEWEEIFEADRNVYAERYRSGTEVLDHPQLIHDRAVVEVTDPERGPVRQPGPQFYLSATPARVTKPAPSLDDTVRARWHGSPTVVAAASSEPGEGLVLEGVTVLELAMQYSAPYGVALLADLGARVIKIEPLEGDPMRRQVGFPEVGGAKVTQGKQSVAVDIRTPEGVAIVHQLAAGVDVVVAGFRPSAARRRGFDPDTLRGLNPDLLYMSAPGYGEGGPCSDRAAFATSFGAASGIAAAHLGQPVTGDPTDTLDEVAAKSHVLYAATVATYASADGIGALGVATGILLGLLARSRGAPGQHLVSSMLLSAAHAMANSIVTFPGDSSSLHSGQEMRGPSALYRIYDAADGWVFLAAPQAKEWEALTNALGPYIDLRADPRFATQRDREANDAALVQALAAVFVRRNKESWQRDLTPADVTCVAVTTGPPEALLTSDRYGRASGYITDVNHPVFDNHPRLAPIVRFSRSRTQAKPGVLCGSHTEQIMSELGYTNEQIADLKTRRIIG
jgi:crotonobetainyl-CoA:carnitine CoA-transferase CaiB-like acyl-CoA transferase